VDTFFTLDIIQATVVTVRIVDLPTSSLHDRQVVCQGVATTCSVGLQSRSATASLLKKSKQCMRYWTQLFWRRKSDTFSVTTCTVLKDLIGHLLQSINHFSLLGETLGSLGWVSPFP